MSSFLDEESIKKVGFKSYGSNVLISKKASFYNPEKIEIGSNVRIDDFCILSAQDKGIQIGSYIHIACYSSLIGAEKIILDDYVNISSRVSIYSTSDDYLGYGMTNPMIPDKYKFLDSKSIFIGKHTVIGSNSIILPGAEIHDGVAVGALSLVNSKLDAWKIYAGIPAKKIKKRLKHVLKKEKNFVNEKNL